MRKILYAFLLACVSLSFSSCTIEVSDRYWGDGYYDENDYLRTKELCRNSWYDSYYDNNGVFCEQVFLFRSDRTGYELLYVYDIPGAEPSVFGNRFSWKWASNFVNNLEIYYGSGSYSYMDDIQFYSNSMSTFLNGTKVVFDRSNNWW